MDNYTAGQARERKLNPKDLSSDGRGHTVEREASCMIFSLFLIHAMYTGLQNTGC